ncbi:MAG: phospholipid carrier-dependent glycosyltransferase [Chloroflexi bacterium]|nr:phospholipid carrier-dependent glycosyltransferase [Chloroflexota bacterium]
MKSLLARASWLLHSVFLLALAAYILAGTALVPFHGDEATILFASRDYEYFVLRADPSLLRYTDTPSVEQDLRLRNGMVSKLLAGLAWHLAGYSVDDLPGPWDWGADFALNAQFGHLPQEGLLLAARWSSALLLALGALIVFALGWRLGSMLSAPLPVAYLASLYYALHPALLLNGRRVMMEGSFTLFTLLIVLTGLLFLRAQNTRGQISAALLLGACSGLALASKQTALVIMAAVLAACGLYIFAAAVRRPAAKTRALLPLLWLALAGTLAAAVFLLLNPVWWDDPLARTLQALQDRQNLLTGQSQFFGGYAGDALVGFWRQTLVALPQYYEAPGWDIHIAEQIARYEASPLRGISMGGTDSGAAALLALALVGAWALLRAANGDNPTRLIFLTWVGVVLLLGLLLTPLEWQRYYLPVYPPLGLLAALGLVWLARALKTRLP